jgi:predicted permease
MARLGSELRQDVGYAVRLIARNPGFSTVAILTLAVAIGGNTTVFGLINALALKPLPVHAPQEIARVYSGESQMSWPNYQDLSQRNTAFADLAAHGAALRALTDGDTSVRVMGEVSSSNYLTLLGVPPLLGRMFTTADDRADIVVLSERTWRTRFASDAALVVRRVTLDKRRYEVIGVMPPGFRGVRPPGLMSEFWIPIDTAPINRLLQDRQKPAFEIVGRLRPGRSVEEAQAEMHALAMQLKAEYPSLESGFTDMEVFPLDGIGGMRGMTNTMLPMFLFVGLMSVIMGFVLLVGCANIAGLLLGRATARRREMAVRLALGAGRGRLIRQLLAESLMLALIGGTAGILLAVILGGGLNAAIARLPYPIELDLALDRRMLAYALALCALTSVLCGLSPARRATRLDVFPALKDEAPRGGRQRLRQALVIGQVTICCLLLLWGGLFLRSLLNAHRVNPGFDPSGVLLASFTLDENAIRDGALPAFVAEMQANIRELPGVEAVGLASIVPLAFTGREEHDMHPDGGAGVRVMRMRLSPGWFEALRISLIAGRDFTAHDRTGAPRVAIVNETVARRFWNGQALGKRMDDAEIVGVVRDSKYWTLGETIKPTVYSALAQQPTSELNLNVRTSNIAGTTAGIRRTLARLAPDLFVEIKPLTAAVGVAIVPAQIGAALTAACGVLAALLAMIGIYGLVTLTVAQRTREIGIRKAIGARTVDIVRLVVRGSVGPAAIGFGLGALLGSLGAFALGGFIVGVSPIDPITIVLTAAIVLSTAIAASALPALRAARVDALLTLKAE